MNSPFFSASRAFLNRPQDFLQNKTLSVPHTTAISVADELDLGLQAQM